MTENILSVKSWRLVLLYFVLLIAITPLSFLLSFLLIHGHLNIASYRGLSQHLLLSSLLWIFIIVVHKEYFIDRKTSLSKQLYHTWKTCFLFMFFLFLYLFIFKKQDYGRLYNTYAIAFIGLLSTLLRLLMILFLRRARAEGFDSAPAVIVGTKKFATDLYYFFRQNPHIGIRVSKVFDNAAHLTKLTDHDIPTADIHTLKSYIADPATRPDYLFICKDLPFVQLTKWSDFGENYLVKTRCVVNTDVLSHITDARIISYNHIPMIALSHTPLDDIENKITKRVFDLCFSFFVLVLVLSWLVPLVGLLIKLESRGPIFFRQKRKGLHDKEFNIFKFRTMRVNQDAHKVIATSNDSRITRVGKFLRKTSLDELPQFLNVLGGSMSVVGPRPMMLKENENFADKIEKFQTRHFAKPGITGLAQTRGFRGGTGMYLMSGRVRLDRLYIYNWSLLLDIKIIILTVHTVFFKKDAY